jgi:ActR/RegA family two-component response regulator
MKVSFTYTEWIQLAKWAYVKAALKEANGNISAAARLIGMHRNTYYNLLKNMRENEKNGN